MYSVELYGRVRRGVLVEGRSQRAVNPGVRYIPGGGKQDAALRGAVRLPAAASSERPKLGCGWVSSTPFSHPTKQRPLAGRTWVNGRLHHREELRARRTSAWSGDVPSADARARGGAGGLRRSAGGGMGQKAHYLAMDLPHSELQSHRSVLSADHDGRRSNCIVHPVQFSINRASVSKVLDFRIPRNPRIHQFNEITVVFRLASERALAGAKVAVQQFMLVPREL